MASTEMDPTLARRPSDSDGSDEKQIGLKTTVVPTDVDAPVELDAAHAVEYVEFLELKRQFEEDPKKYKALIRKCIAPQPALRCPGLTEHNSVDLRIIPMLFLYYLLNSLDSMH